MWRFFLQYLKLLGEYNQQRCVTVYRIELQANANWICGGWLPAPQCVSVSVFACGIICVHRPLVLMFDHTCYGGNLVQWYKLLRFFVFVIESFGRMFSFLFQFICALVFWLKFFCTPFESCLEYIHLPRQVGGACLADHNDYNNGSTMWHG